MKPKNKIYPLLRMLAVALTAALLGPGCQKDFKWNEPLAVTQNGLNLTCLLYTSPSPRDTR